MIQQPHAFGKVTENLWQCLLPPGEREHLWPDYALVWEDACS